MGHESLDPVVAEMRAIRKVFEKQFNPDVWAVCAAIHTAVAAAARTHNSVEKKPKPCLETNPQERPPDAS